MSRPKVVVLDDDATGSQAVRDVELLLRPDRASIEAALDSDAPGFFVLTNSRSLAPDRAGELARRLGRDIAAASRRLGRTVSVVSRSDSTLRGHFPGEVDALAEGLGMTAPRILLAPYFGEGGRVTIDDVHLLERDGARVPVAETEFALDPVFGYRSSNLPEWVREKAPGREVRSVPLEVLRETGGMAVEAALADVPSGGVVVVNAAQQRDIELTAEGAVAAEAAGMEVIARTAASFVRARLGQPVWPLLDELPGVRAGPGLVVAGSHVPTTSAQLERLVDDPPAAIEAIELDVRGPRAAAAVADAALRSGRTVVLATSRHLQRGTEPGDDLRIGARFADAVVEAVREMHERPAWIVAKGGITSHDVAARALGASTATVLGQVAAGVSLWRLGPDAAHPGVPFVVFPGNVGSVGELRAVVAALASASS